MEFLIKKAKLQAVSVKWLPAQSISRPIDIQIQSSESCSRSALCMRKSVIGQHRKLHIFKAGGPRFFSIFKMAAGKEMLHVLCTPLWLFKWFAAGGPLALEAGAQTKDLTSASYLEEFLTTSAFNLVLGQTLFASSKFGIFRFWRKS